MYYLCSNVNLRFRDGIEWNCYNQWWNHFDFWGKSRFSITNILYQSHSVTLTCVDCNSYHAWG